MTHTTNSPVARYRRALMVIVGSLLLGTLLTGCSAKADAGMVSVELRDVTSSASDGLFLVTLDRGKTHLTQRLSAHSSYAFPSVAEGKIAITIEGFCTFTTSLGTQPIRAIVDRKHCTLSD